MIEAFKVLNRLPGGIGPIGIASNLAKFGGLFQEEQDPDEVEEETKRRFAWSASKPSPAAVSRMEQAIEWPMRHLKEDSEACRCLLAWAIGKARGRRIDTVARRLGITRDEFDEHRRRGAYALAVALSRAGVPVA